MTDVSETLDGLQVAVEMSSTQPASTLFSLTSFYYIVCVGLELTIFLPQSPA